MSWWDHIHYFTPSEFVCKCCGKQDMQKEFVLRLDMLRGRLGVPLTITSGFRCEKHDKEVGGKSNHTTGRAADIRMDGQLMYRVLPLVGMVGFTGLGVGIKQGFIHLDDLQKNPRPNVWSY